jgi:hypothetical protein
MLREALYVLDRAVAQAFSRWLPTVAAQVKSRGICGGQSVPVVHMHAYQ